VRFCEALIHPAIAFTRDLSTVAEAFGAPPWV
jgi:hypothetical protein